MASRKIESARSKGKYMGGPYPKDTVLKPSDLHETGPPIQCKEVDLNVLIAQAETVKGKVETVPRFKPIGAVGVVVVPGQTESGPSFLVSKKHKDLPNSEDFVDSAVAAIQNDPPFNILWENVYVSHAEGPHCFWVIDGSQASNDRYDSLDKKMNLYYTKFHAKHEPLPSEELVVGHYYVVGIWEDDTDGQMNWKRCKLLELIGGRTASVRLLDSGETRVVDQKNFRRVYKKVAAISARAYQVILFGLSGRPISARNCQRFKDRVAGVRYLAYLGSLHIGDFQVFKLHLVGINADNENEEVLPGDYE